MWLVTTPLGVSAIFALILRTSGQDADDVTRPDIRALFDTNVTLSCNHSGLPDDFQFVMWLRPDGTPMQAGCTDRFRILDGSSGWHVSADGKELFIETLQEQEFGVYNCIGAVGSNLSDPVVRQTGLNVDGPYFGDLWPEYRMNTIIGLGSAGGFLVIVIAIYVVYHFRYKGDDRESPEVSERGGGSGLDEIDNEGMTLDEGDVIWSGSDVERNAESASYVNVYDGSVHDETVVHSTELRSDDQRSFSELWTITKTDGTGKPQQTTEL